MAVTLREQFPEHTVEYWHGAIIQNAKRKRTIKLTRWNAFVSQEVRRMNDGEFFSLIFFSPFFLSSSAALFARIVHTARAPSLLSTFR